MNKKKQKALLKKQLVQQRLDRIKTKAAVKKAQPKIQKIQRKQTKSGITPTSGQSILEKINQNIEYSSTAQFDTTFGYNDLLSISKKPVEVFGKKVTLNTFSKDDKVFCFYEGNIYEVVDGVLQPYDYVEYNTNVF